MIDLNDVLLAMSNIPVDDPIAEIWGRGLQGGDKIIEYTGSLPITIRANGDALIDYRIYGSNDGCGEQTENLFDMRESSQGEGYVPNAVLRADNTTVVSSSFFISEYLKIHGNLSYYIFFDIFRTSIASICFYKKINDSFVFISAIAEYNSRTFITPSEAEYVRFTVDKNATQAILVEGSTAPTEYVPYGYKLPMTVGDGSTVQSVPVYIGENQLGEDEYVSFSDQKIYRDVSGTLTPTAPTVPLPEIPAIDGETVIDYDGEPKPSQMYVKYKGKG